MRRFACLESGLCEGRAVRKDLPKQKKIQNTAIFLELQIPSRPTRSPLPCILPAFGYRCAPNRPPGETACRGGHLAGPVFTSKQGLCI